jgi:membrane protein implicated in regulation of membrane protease activity
MTPVDDKQATREKSLMRLFVYLIRQMPEWLLIGLFLVALREWLGASWSLAIAALVLWILKDLAIHLWLPRPAGFPPLKRTEELVGDKGVVRNSLDPVGYILTHGELWRAEAVSDEGPIPVGTPVQILEARGLTLWVRKNEC